MERIFLCALQFVKFSDLGQSVALRASNSWFSRCMLIVGKLLTWLKAFVHRHLRAVMVEGYMFLRTNYFVERDTQLISAPVQLI